MKQLFCIICITLCLAGFGVGCKQSTSNVEPQQVQTQDQSVVEGPVEVRASHILVKTVEEANDLKAKIDNGEDFANLAKQYSTCPSGKEGGDLGYFTKGQMVPEFETVAFSLPVGKVSDPVKTQFGWHLILVSDTK